MKKKILFLLSALLFVFFALLTFALLKLDVKAIGAGGTNVGLSTINGWFFSLTGVNLLWYHITDWLGLLPLAVAAIFAFLGAAQLIKRKSIKKVDREIILMGIFYVLVIAFYIFFETKIINYRPIIIYTSPEASYPSSHTMMVICIMWSAAIAVKSMWGERKVLCKCVNALSVILIAITIIGRLISGVHWLTDIIGGMVLSSALVLLYRAAVTE